MKAVVITRPGGPEVLHLQDVPEPQPKPGEIVVRVEAGGVNFADILSARGNYPGTPKPPFTAGREFAGVVEQTGKRVMGYTQWGAFAERVAISEAYLWPQPEGWSSEQSAAFPVNYFTAYFAYWKAGLLEAHELPPTVLIHAVAGGVGTAAVEIGHVLGVEMFGTSSSDEKLASVQALGLQHPINYAREDYVDAVMKATNHTGVDAVFEMLGGEHTMRSVRCLKFLGRIIQYGSATGKPATVDARELFARQTSVHGLWLSPLSGHAEIMRSAWQKLSEWIGEGKLRPQIGHVLKMSQAEEGYRLLSDRKNYGKVVLKW